MPIERVLRATRRPGDGVREIAAVRIVAQNDELALVLPPRIKADTIETARAVNDSPGVALRWCHLSTSVINVTTSQSVIAAAKSGTSAVMHCQKPAAKSVFRNSMPPV